VQVTIGGTVDERILGRCDRYDTGTYTSPTKHVIVLKCPNASKTGRQAYNPYSKQAVEIWDFPRRLSEVGYLSISQAVMSIFTLGTFPSAESDP